MIRTLDFNAFAAGTIIDDEYEGVTISATGGSGQAMIFDSANPTGGDGDLASDKLGGLLIISEDGDASDPDDNATGGTITFDFANIVRMKSITFKDIEETSGPGTRIIFYDENDAVIENQFVDPTGDGGEATVQLFVPGTARVEIVFQGSGAIDNVTFDDPGFIPNEGSGEGIVSNGDEAALIDTSYAGDPEGDFIDNGDAILPGEAPQDDIVDAQGGNDTIQSGLGDDEVYAGAGDDVVEGGVGDDIIYGDSELGGTGGTPTGPNLIVNGSFEDTSGLTSTGYGFVGDGAVPGWTESNGAEIDIHSDGRGNVDASDGANWLDLSASPSVGAVGQDVAGVTAGQSYQLAFDAADGDNLPGGENLIEVYWGGELLDTIDPTTSDMVRFEYTVQGGAGDGTNRLEFREQGGNDAFGASVDNVSLIALTPEVVAGNDDLNGEDGDDLIFGEGGDDTLTGGAGVDTILGGDDADTFIGGNAGDNVDGGAGGDDNDTLDLSDAGPLRVLTQTDDPDGNSTSGTIGFLDPDGNVVGDVLTFTEIENLILPPENVAPVTVDDALVTDEDTPSAPLNVLDNDSDPDGDPLTLTSATSPDGNVTFTPEGEVVFTPNPDFNGETTITYTVEDPSGEETPGTVNVTVNPVNDAPVAVDDTEATEFETPVVVDLIGNDTDVDNPTSDLTLVTATVPEEQGTLVDNGDGTVTFTPADGFAGEATITYTVADPGGLTDEGEAVVTVAEDTRDGFVDGTDGDDLIDESYTGDPDGDLIDANDEILPGAGPNDDFVRAGDGDDTVIAGEGDDSVEAGAGDDSVDGGVGDDTVIGADGNDTVNGGDGDDVIDTSGSDLAPDLGYPFADSDPLGFDPDTDPENDRDLVDGGAGDDDIRTGDDRDTIFGGTGNDSIDAGIDDDIIDGGADDDRIVGGEGNDSILGGTGNDTIYAGNDPDLGLDALDIPDEASDDFPFSPDRNPDNGRDTVNGGAGDDVIFGADDDDLLIGGSGNDFLDGQIDDDTLQGGSGEDTLIGGQGDDSLSGGTGNDTLEGGIGNDTLRGNRDDDLLNGGDGDDVLDGGGENDTLFGGGGNDSLQGGQGDDVLDGGDGDDSITGGAGMDMFMGGAGNDTMIGGGDQDTFSGVNGGDVIDGSSAGIDQDTLDLRGSAPDGGRLEVTFTSPDEEDGFVTYFDADNNALPDVLVFEEIETIIPCFTPGTRIATPSGERRVEDLQVGDRVITRDNGIQEIRWVGARDMFGADLERAAHLKPVLIRQGALGNDLPERDMMVSPNHRVLVANDKTALYFEEREVLVAAKHLTGLDGIDIVDVSHTTYIHIMFAQHEVVLSDGTWTESFQPGDMTLAGVGNAQRTEILELFPELATAEGIEAYASARRSLKKHEAQLLTK